MAAAGLAQALILNSLRILQEHGMNEAAWAWTPRISPARCGSTTLRLPPCPRRRHLSQAARFEITRGGDCAAARSSAPVRRLTSAGGLIASQLLHFLQQFKMKASAR